VSELNINKLKPCPFCGADPVVNDLNMTIYCPVCNAEMNAYSHQGMSDIILMWNKRTPA